MREIKVNNALISAIVLLSSLVVVYLLVNFHQAQGVGSSLELSETWSKPVDRSAMMGSEEETASSPKRKRILGARSSSVSYSEARQRILEPIYSFEVSTADLVFDLEASSGQMFAFSLNNPSAELLEEWQDLKTELLEKLPPDEQPHFEAEWRRIMYFHGPSDHPFRMIYINVPMSHEDKILSSFMRLDVRPDKDLNFFQISDSGTEYVSDDDSDWNFKHLVTKQNEK